METQKKVPNEITEQEKTNLIENEWLTELRCTLIDSYNDVSRVIDIGDGVYSDRVLNMLKRAFESIKKTEHMINIKQGSLLQWMRPVKNLDDTN